jgi:hypothetical protein
MSSKTPRTSPRGVAGEQALERGEDAGQGGAQLVGDVVEELRLAAVGVLDLAVLLGDLLVALLDALVDEAELLGGPLLLPGGVEGAAAQAAVDEGADDDDGGGDDQEDAVGDEDVPVPVGQRVGSRKLRKARKLRKMAAAALAIAVGPTGTRMPTATRVRLMPA